MNGTQLVTQLGEGLVEVWLAENGGVVAVGDLGAAPGLGYHWEMW